MFIRTLLWNQLKLWKGLHFIRNDHYLATPDSSNIDDKKKWGNVDTCFIERISKVLDISNFVKNHYQILSKKSIDTFILSYVFSNLAN